MAKRCYRKLPGRRKRIRVKCPKRGKSRGSRKRSSGGSRSNSGRFCVKPGSGSTCAIKCFKSARAALNMKRKVPGSVATNKHVKICKAARANGGGKRFVTLMAQVRRGMRSEGKAAPPKARKRISKAEAALIKQYANLSGARRRRRR